MKTPEEYARAALDAVGGRDGGPLDTALPALMELFRAALADAPVEAAGGIVTPDRLARAEELAARHQGCGIRLRAALAGLPADLDEAVRNAFWLASEGRLFGAEVRRLWAVMGDVWRDSAMCRHGFVAGWRACAREAARIAEEWGQADAIDERAARPIGALEMIERYGSCRLNHVLYQLEPPAPLRE
jgi:hypothetical protein